MHLVIKYKIKLAQKKYFDEGSCMKLKLLIALLGFGILLAGCKEQHGNEGAGNVETSNAVSNEPIQPIQPDIVKTGGH